jgi:hypothetical protein
VTPRRAAGGGTVTVAQPRRTSSIASSSRVRTHAGTRRGSRQGGRVQAAGRQHRGRPRRSAPSATRSSTYGARSVQTPCTSRQKMAAPAGPTPLNRWGSRSTSSLWSCSRRRSPRQSAHTVSASSLSEFAVRQCGGGGRVRERPRGPAKRLRARLVESGKCGGGSTVDFVTVQGGRLLPWRD